MFLGRREQTHRSLQSSCTRRENLNKCLVPPWAGTSMWKSSQNTLPRPTTLESNRRKKAKKSAHRIRLSLDNRGPSMWPRLSSPFYCLPHLVQYWSLWKARRERVSRPVLVAS